MKQCYMECSCKYTHNRHSMGGPHYSCHGLYLADVWPTCIAELRSACPNMHIL